ncbi:hypothetical protein FZEAL_4667 [Fusarium zealandicum]|uniref:Nudix hydrolase domain-containing protein n=1 Tax=Fusarium zealandicum TaxID=1053134 RepID=A0A8H4UM14_9HYPO|nr:hypothetical protein FZEAL_4667 [Fusarium zealandicum]
MSSSPPASYTISPSLDAFTSTSPAAFLAANPPIQHLIAGAVVTNPQGQILLIRRAAHDSWPLQWEVPGGCVDASDATLVAAAVRELHEETGLRATAVRCVVRLAPPDDAAPDKPADALEVDLRVLGDVVVFSDGGEVWGKMTAWVDVESCDVVRICDDEHCEFAWVTEQETRDTRFKDGRDLDFVSDGVRRTVLEGFRLWRDQKESN